MNNESNSPTGPKWEVTGWGHGEELAQSFNNVYAVLNFCGRVLEYSVLLLPFIHAAKPSREDCSTFGIDLESSLNPRAYINCN